MEAYVLSAKAKARATAQEAKESIAAMKAKDAPEDDGKSSAALSQSDQLEPHAAKPALSAVSATSSEGVPEPVCVRVTRVVAFEPPPPVKVAAKAAQVRPTVSPQSSTPEAAQ